MSNTPVIGDVFFPPNNIKILNIYAQFLLTVSIQKTLQQACQLASIWIETRSFPISQVSQVLVNHCLIFQGNLFFCGSCNLQNCRNAELQNCRKKIAFKLFVIRNAIGQNLLFRRTTPNWKIFINFFSFCKLSTLFSLAQNFFFVGPLASGAALAVSC